MKKNSNDFQLVPNDLLNNVPGGLAVYKVTDTFETLYYNDGVCALTSHTREEYEKVIQHNAMDIVFPEDRERLGHEIMSAAKEKRKVEISYRILRNHGGFVWVHLSAVLRDVPRKGLFCYAIFMDISKEREVQNSLSEQVEKDSLTGLLDRIGFEKKIKAALDVGTDHQATFIMLDIDNFKQVNDVYGHTKGDETLCSFARILQQVFDKNSYVARMGGDEFAVFIDEPKTKKQLDSKVIELSDAIIKNHNEIEQNIYISCSLGIALAPKDGDGFHTLYAKADKALLYAKSNGKNQHHYFGEELEHPLALPLNNLDWLLDATSNGIYICNSENYELMYVNKFVKDLCNIKGTDYMGKTCYSVLLGLDKPCEICPLSKMSREQFLEREFMLQSHGMSLILRGKVFNWNGIKAHIEFITDNTQQALANKKLEKTAISLKLQQEKYDIALKNANICIWEYNIKEKVIIQSDNAMLIYPFGRIIEKPSESLIEKGYIAEDCIENYRALYRNVESGEKDGSAEIHWIGFGNNNDWWARIKYTVIFDEEGMPMIAVGAMVDITNEKMALKRYEDELLMRELSTPMTIVSFRANLTLDTVEECNINSAKVGNLKDIKSVDKLFQTIDSTFLGEEDRENAKILNRKLLIEKFNEQITHLETSYRRVFNDGSVLRLHVTIKLMKHPMTSDIMAFIYTVDITENSIMESAIHNFVKYFYDYIMFIDGNRGRYQTYYDEENASIVRPIREGIYTDYVKTYLCRYAVEEEWEHLFASVELSKIYEELALRDTYEVIFHTHDKYGGVISKELRFSYIEKGSNTLLLAQYNLNRHNTKK
ncbi:MAG: sensor domain-containing diguanylate cyclase [Clostridium sp.]